MSYYSNNGNGYRYMFPPCNFLNRHQISSQYYTINSLHYSFLSQFTVHCPLNHRDIFAYELYFITFISSWEVLTSGYSRSRMWSSIRADCPHQGGLCHGNIAGLWGIWVSWPCRQVPLESGSRNHSGPLVAYWEGQILYLYKCQWNWKKLSSQFITVIDFYFWFE